MSRPPLRDFLPPLRAAAIAFFLCASVSEYGASGFIAVAAGCHFLSRARALVVAPVFALMAFFDWSALLAGALLFSAFSAEVWSSLGRLRQLTSLTYAGLAMMSLLFCGIPGVNPYVDAIVVPLAPLALFIAATAMLSYLAREEHVTTDPLLTLLLTAFTMCYLLAAALLAVSISYPEAILLSLFGVVAALALALVVMRQPTQSDGNLNLVQHIFSLRVPIEKWVADISTAVAAEQSADAFAAYVMQWFLSLPGVTGARWRLDDAAEQIIGGESRHFSDYHLPPLTIRLYLRRRVSPWDSLNYYLLTRIVSEYCRAKKREEDNRVDNLSRAIHQTGARLTHDIKNILHTLMILMQSDDSALMRRQLPALRERLEVTLAKLQLSDRERDSRLMDARQWWESARARHAHQPVLFEAVDESGAAAAGGVPRTLFDLALDNLIANAVVKWRADNTVKISARLTVKNAACALQVQDSGEAAPPDVAYAMFARPIESASGFGIGLYQTQEEAEKNGYALSLEGNSDGRVIVELSALPDAYEPPPRPSASKHHT